MVGETPCRRLVPLALLVSLACAHGGGAARATPLTRDEKALAQAVFWIMRVATDADRYRLEIEAQPASLALLEETARVSGSVRSGGSLRSRNAGRGGVVTIRASTPTWSTPNRATILLAYAVGQGKPIACEIWLIKSEPADDWSMKTPSDVPCWPRPESRRDDEH